MSFIQAANGLSIGYLFTSFQRNEAKAREENQHYLCAGFQIGQGYFLSQLGTLFVNSIPNDSFRAAASLSKKTISVLSLVLISLGGVVKEKKYEETAENVNGFFSSHPILPAKLSDRSIRCITFISDHIGDVFRIGLLVSVVALPVIGQFSMAGGLAGAIAFDALDSKGLLPERVSLLMNRSLMVLTNGLLFINGGLLMRIMSAANLITSISTSTNWGAYQKLDNFYHSLVESPLPTIEVIDAPFQERALSSDEIQKILNQHVDIVPNPTHCSKEASTEDPIMSGLQELRKQIIEAKIEEMGSKLPGGSEVFGKIWYPSLALGFYPLTEQERESFGFMNLLNRVSFTPFHEEMCEEYRKQALQFLQIREEEEIRGYFERTLNSFPPQELDNIMQHEGRFRLLLVLVGVFQMDLDPISSFELSL